MLVMLQALDAAMHARWFYACGGIRYPAFGSHERSAFVCIDGSHMPSHFVSI
jgi:hypothetical protein